MSEFIFVEITILLVVNDFVPASARNRRRSNERPYFVGIIVGFFS